MLSSGERKGLIVLVTISGLSILSVLLLLGSLLSQKQTIRPIGLFFLCLLFWELVQAVGWFITLRWAVLGAVEAGTYCATQAILKQFNATGTALTTIGLSWCILQNYVFQMRDLPLRGALIVLVAISILQLIVILVPTVVVGASELYQPSGVWCWIPEHKYYALKIVTTYLFYWVAAGFSLLSALAYLASAYVDRRLPCGYFWIGFLTRRNGLLRMGFFSELVSHDREPMFGFTFDVLWFGRNKSIFFVQYLGPPPIPVSSMSGVDSKSTTSVEDNKLSRTPMRDALMLLSLVSNLLVRLTSLDVCRFPIAYAILVIPLSIVRYITFRGKELPPAAYIFAGAWFALTGLVEVLLFVLLKPDFGLRMPRILDRRPR